VKLGQWVIILGPLVDAAAELAGPLSDTRLQLSSMAGTVEYGCEAARKIFEPGCGLVP
jgi:hypothetical protein